MSETPNPGTFSVTVSVYRSYADALAARGLTILPLFLWRGVATVPTPGRVPFVPLAPCDVVFVQVPAALLPPAPDAAP